MNAGGKTHGVKVGIEPELAVVRRHILDRRGSSIVTRPQEDVEQVASRKKTSANLI